MYPRMLTILLLSYHMVAPECSYIIALLFLREVIIRCISRLRYKGEGQTWKFHHGPPSQRLCLATWLEGRESYGAWCTATQFQAHWASEHGW